MERIAVIDFETTGLSPAQGARATEIAIVILEDGKLLDRFQSLMNGGAWVPPEIARLTGITNEMLSRAPPAGEVMQAASTFLGKTPLLAHNASFDSSFLISELARIGEAPKGRFACTMLLARRLIPQAANFRLQTLAGLAKLPSAGRAHRALADAETTAHLFNHLELVLEAKFGRESLSHELLRRIQKRPIAGFATYQKAPKRGRPCNPARSTIVPPLDSSRPATAKNVRDEGIPDAMRHDKKVAWFLAALCYRCGSKKKTRVLELYYCAGCDSLLGNPMNPRLELLSIN